jgi:hypothetical protein
LRLTEQLFVYWIVLQWRKKEYGEIRLTFLLLINMKNKLSQEALRLESQITSSKRFRKKTLTRKQIFAAKSALN